MPVLEYLDRLSDAAALIGAVNCITRDGDQLVGENTDGKGFLESLRGVIDPRGKRVVLLGAGGAARAIAVELALAGAAAITVVNRSAERGQSLVDRLNEKTATPAALLAWEGDFRVPADTDVLVNATSIGLNDESARVPVNLDERTADISRGRRHRQSPGYAVGAQEPAAWVQDARRRGDDRQPGSDQLQALDWRRRGHPGDARGGRGVCRVVDCRPAALVRRASVARGCCCVMQWNVPSPQASSTARSPTHLPVGKQLRQRLDGDCVGRATELRHDDDAIGDVEIRIAGRQASVVVINGPWHRQRHDFQRPSLLVGGRLQAAQVVGQSLVVLVGRILLDRRDHGARTRRIGASSSMWPSVSSPTIPSPSQMTCRPTP